MMISPETYYEEYLKGKTIEQLQTAIRSLKKEMGHLEITYSNGRKPVSYHGDNAYPYNIVS